MKTSLARAITPRSMEHWKRPLGFGNRVEIQALQLSKYPLQAIGANRALLRIENRIAKLQENPYQYSAQFNRALSWSAIKLNSAFLTATAASVALSALHHQIEGQTMGLHDAPILGIPLTLVLIAGHYIKNSYLAEKRSAYELANSEGALRVSKQRYKDLFQKAPVGFHNISPDGKIIDVNRRWLSMLGYAREEVLGKEIFDFIVPEQQGNARARFAARKAGATLPPLTQERQYLRKDGSIVVARTFDNDVRDESGKLVFVQTSFLDLTELKQLQNEKSDAEVREKEMEATIQAINGLTHTLSQSFTALSMLVQMGIASRPEFKATADQVVEELSTYFQAFDLIRFGVSRKEKVEVKPFAERIFGETSRKFLTQEIEKRLEVKDDLGQIDTSVEALRIILESVLANAFEAVDGKGWVSLSIRKRVVEDKETLTIFVRDNGRGIRPDVAQKNVPGLLQQRS
ncbi:PAS domain S-box protein [Candidatus Margulisiibacteriota bacterium]